MKGGSLLKKRTKFLATAALLLAGFYCVCLCRCELLTAVHGREFEGLDLNTGLLERSDSLKVLDYSGTEASIYYVGPGRSYGNVLRFSRDTRADPWNLDGWDTVWSKSGSADGLVWPYFR